MQIDFSFYLNLSISEIALSDSRASLFVGSVSWLEAIRF
jgi:hypothetical protein